PIAQPNQHPGRSWAPSRSPQALIHQYAGLVGDLKRHRNDPQEFRARISEVDRVYPAIWQRLAHAANPSRAASREIAAYDAVRQQAGDTVHSVITDIVERQPLYSAGKILPHEVVFHLDARGAQLAREACARVTAAWPETDWSARDEEVPDL